MATAGQTSMRPPPEWLFGGYSVDIRDASVLQANTIERVDRPISSTSSGSGGAELAYKAVAVVILEGEDEQWTFETHGLEDSTISTTFEQSIKMVSEAPAVPNPALQLIIVDHNDKEGQPTHPGPTLRQSYLSLVCSGILTSLGLPAIPRKDAITYASFPPRLSQTVAKLSSLRNVHLYRVTAGCFDMIWAHGHTSHVVCGIINHSGPQAGDICAALREDLYAHRSLARHPMLLALLAHFHIAPHMERWLRRHASGVVQAAQDSGFHHDLTISERRRLVDTELGGRSAIVSGIAANVATNRNCWAGLYGLSQFIIQECGRLEQHSRADSSQDRQSVEHHYITQHAESCAMNALAFRDEADSWQQKASIQIQGLFNLIAQRDQNQSISLATSSKTIAEESKKDSTSMKALAVVTMCFLPGTFISSLFAIPFFQWDASPGHAVINKRMWVYWAFSIPLTVFILLWFIIWDRRINKRDSSPTSLVTEKSR